MNRSEAFLEEIDKVYQRKLPADVLARARQSLLDYLAVTCAGAHFQAEKLDAYFDFAQPEEGRFSAIGTDRKLALKEAVFLNGLNAHALDFDDGTNSGIIHLGSPIFSLLLPLSQRYEVSLEKLLHAAVTGYEASYTMAVSIQPGHKAMGYHATGTCGVLGATLAASYMLDFTKEERFQAFASAAVSASGMLKVLDDGSELKPYNVAKTALLSLTSLQLAKAGFRGHEDPLGGRGFLKMMTGREDVEIKSTMLDGSYAIMKTYTKPYASCRYTHPAVEAAIGIRNEQGITASDVERIDIETYDLAVAGHEHTRIANSYSAKMSTPYAVAVGLIYGKAGFQEFEEDLVSDPTVCNLTEKVHVTANDELSAVFPKKQAAIVTVQARGERFTKRVDFPKGEPENPLTGEEFKARYDGLMAYGGVDSAASDRIYSEITTAGDDHRLHIGI